MKKDNQYSIQHWKFLSTYTKGYNYIGKSISFEINPLKNPKTIANNSFMPEQQNTKERNLKTEPKIFGWKRWLNYQSIVKQVPFFLFLAMLAVIYIYNGHFADKTIRSINKTAKEVKELQYEYKTVKSEVMFRSKQSELVKAVEPLGLKELTDAPIALKGEKESAGSD